MPTRIECFTRDLKKVAATYEFSTASIRLLNSEGEVEKLSSTNPKSDECELVSVLRRLTRVFDEIRAGAIKRLGGNDWFEKLPANDPLRNRVGLFDTLDLGLRETAHTRALAWMLDPQAEHGFGAILLQAFLREIFDLSDDPQVAGVRVHSELRSSESQSRFDVFLQGNWTLPGQPVEPWMVIVEAKVEAAEGDDQCIRYEARLQERVDAFKSRGLVFLTPEGRKPRTASDRESSAWTPLSFVRLIALFRTRLPKLQEKPGHEFLRLYMTGVLKDLYDFQCGRPEGTSDVYRIIEYLGAGSDGGN